MIIEKHNYNVFIIFRNILYNILYKISKLSKKILYQQKGIVFYNSISTQTDNIIDNINYNTQNKCTQCNLAYEEIDEIINSNILADIEKLDRDFSPTKHKWYFSN